MGPRRLRDAVRGTLAFGLALSISACGPGAAAGEWPRWRGPNGDGTVAAPAREGRLPAELPPVWKKEIGGGYSGPVVQGERVWVHARRGDDEIVSCLDLKTGETIWSRSYAASFRQDDDALSHGRGPYATPALADGRLFTFGVTSVLTAWDAASGEMLWRKSSADAFDPAFPYFGNAASPVVWHDLVYVALGGRERGRADSPSKGAMVALKAGDGTEVWRWAADGPALGATPVIAEIEGAAQLVFKTTKLIVGADPRSGRELWRIPYAVSMDNTIVTPLFVGGRLVTSDYDWGIAAWAIGRGDEGWTARQLWRHRDVSLFMSSPVMAGGLVVGLSHLNRGQLFLLDPERGEVRWRGSGRSGEHASLVAWGDEVWVFNDGGVLIVGRVEKASLRETRRYRLGDAVGWSHPAVVGDRIVFRDGEALEVVRFAER